MNDVYPLHKAVLREETQIIELLLMYGADPRSRSLFRIGEKEVKYGLFFIT